MTEASGFMSKGLSTILQRFAVLPLVLAASAFAQSAPPQPSGQPEAAPPQSAQQPAPPAGADKPQNGQQEYTITRQVNEVDLVFAVTDKHGHFISDLKQSDFALLDDCKAPERVYRFTQQTNLPLRVGIVIDTSTSIRTRFQFEQQASIEFLLQILKPRSDKGFVMGFDVVPDYKQDWTNNLDLLTTGINSLRPGGGTALFDAVY